MRRTLPARLAIACAAAVLALLGGLHILSPEFDPSWRVISEYATGQYGWVLSLLFGCWALSSWALVVGLRAQVGQVGLVFLTAAGVGEAMAAFFDITHPLHGLAGIIGLFSLPIAAVLFARSLPTPSKVLVWTAHSTWLSLVALIATLVAMIVGYTQAGNQMTPDVLAVVGYADRVLVVAYCAWVIIAARQALRFASERPSATPARNSAPCHPELAKDPRAHRFRQADPSAAASG
jgi:uncharacterized membrane protein YkvA (DUF1232 family)